MPFTFSHPAIVLPAKYLPKNWVSMTALVTGSITPDFEYFIRMKNMSIYSHTWLGMFWFDLPLAFALTFIYHNLVRDSLINNLPGFGRRRLSIYKGFNWNEYVKQHFIVVTLSLLIGIASHVAWDAFTHPNGYFVAMIPWLKQNSEVFGVFHTRFHILQVASSLVGGIVVIASLFSIPTDNSVPHQNIFKYWLVALLVATAAISLRMIGGLNLHWMGEVTMSVISAGLIALVLTPQILKLLH
jgi:hypothetical protein